MAIDLKRGARASDARPAATTTEDSLALPAQRPDAVEVGCAEIASIAAVARAKVRGGSAEDLAHVRAVVAGGRQKP